MKILKTLSALAISATMVFSVAALNVSAATTTQDGLEVSLTTDKEAYSKDEKITATLSVKNTNESVVTDIAMETIIPDGYEVADGTKNNKQLDKLAPNESAELKVVYVAKDSGEDNQDSEISQVSQESQNSEISTVSPNNDSPRTGDNATIPVAIAIVLLVSVLLAVFCFKSKKGRKLLSVILTVSIIGGTSALISVNTNAIEDNKPINVETSIIVEGKSLKLNGTVRYNVQATVDDEVVLSNFTSDEQYFICGQETTVTFTVEVSNPKDKVELIKNNDELVGYMHDDGLNGDVTANDGTYTYVEKEIVNSVETLSVMYNAQSSDSSSNMIALYFFVPLTEDTAKTAKDNYQLVLDKISEIESPYLNEDGFINEADKPMLVNSVKILLNDLVESKIVLLFEEENGNFDIKLTSGLAIAYSPRSERGKNVDSINADTSATVLTFQPCFTDMGGQNYSTTAYTLPEGVNFVLEMLDDVATDIDDTFSNYSFSASTNYNDDRVTLNTIRSLHENEIVLWHGHGYYGPMVKSCLVTGEDFDWNGWWWDTTGYFADCVTNRIINSWITGYDKVIISSGYIEKYCGNLNNSLIYLAACDSGKTSELANSFLNRGSAAVVANSDTIIREYNVVMLYETLRNMSMINPATQNYYTLQEALTTAKALYGNDDSDSRYGGSGATPNIFGGTSADNYRLYDNRIYVSGKVTDEKNNSLNDVHVNIVSNDNTININQSTNNGEYSFELHKDNKTYTLTFEKEGYVTQTQTLSNVDVDRTVNVVLKAKDGIIFGKVLTENSEPIKNAKVTANKYEVYTNANGEFSISLPKGNYFLEVTYDGYQPTKIANINVQPGKTTKLNNIVLKIDSKITIPTDALSYNGHSYYIYSGVANTWEEAKAYCESLGGYLAVVNDEAENTALYNYMKSCGYQSAYFGYSDSETEGVWKWVSNDTSNYTNWASGEPNQERTTEDYAMFYFKYTDGKWNDGDFNGRTVQDTSAFICEWDSVDNGNKTIYLEQIAIKESDQYNDNEGDSFVFPIGKHRFTRGNTDINGISYEHGIEGWIARWNYTAESSWAYSIFDLSGKYSSLNGKCVLIQSANTTDFDTTLDFIGDGNLIKSYHLTPDAIPFDINLNVSGVKELKVYFHDNAAKKSGTSFGLVNMELSKDFSNSGLDDNDSIVSDIIQNYSGTTYYAKTTASGGGSRNFDFFNSRYVDYTVLPVSENENERYLYNFIIYDDKVYYTTAAQGSSIESWTLKSCDLDGSNISVLLDNVLSEFEIKNGLLTIGVSPSYSNTFLHYNLSTNEVIQDNTYRIENVKTVSKCGGIYNPTEFDGGLFYREYKDNSVEVLYYRKDINSGVVEKIGSGYQPSR